MKVAVIGGGGRVGSDASYALQLGGVVREVVLLDANADLAAGEALDQFHGSPLISDCLIRPGVYDDVADADVVCITAGLRRKPDESRLDLINRNVELFKGILKSLAEATLRKEAILLTVSNPVDILTRLARETLDWCPKRCIGLGTVLDTCRFRSLIAQELRLAPTQVNAQILGEHGDTMFPVWSSASVDGLPLLKWPGMTTALQNALFERTRGSGAEVIKRKGGAGRAVGVSIAAVVHALALNSGRLLPVCSCQSGAYGLKSTAISVPTILARQGVVRHVELDLFPKELLALTNSAKALDGVYGQIRR